MTDPVGTNPIRWTIAGLVTLALVLGVSLFLFALGLIVQEAVIWPTSTLATSVIAALVGAPLSDWARRDGTVAQTGEVVRRTLAWALLPALVILLFPLLIGQLRLIWWIGLVALYTTSAAYFFASRFRAPAGATHRLKPSLYWLLGTALTLIGIIFLASLFGLTGA